MNNDHNRERLIGMLNLDKGTALKDFRDAMASRISGGTYDPNRPRLAAEFGKRRVRAGIDEIYCTNCDCWTDENDVLANWGNCPACG